MPAHVPRPVVLTGHHVRLEPLGRDHLGDLFATCGGDDEVWRWLIAPTPRTPQELAAFVEPLLVQMHDGERVQFAVRDRSSGRAIGIAGYRAFDVRHERIKLSWLVIARPYWRTAAACGTLALQLAHAFEDLGMRRVFWHTDHRNHRARGFFDGVGAHCEGTHRQDIRLPDGTFRDSDYYSVLREEWPEVKARLTARVARGPAGPEPSPGRGGAGDGAPRASRRRWAP